ncbi:helix-turn-helix transcriptional regulator [Corynebacterium epidermidicanis]|uniref:Putative transcriptional regulator n=1 Tax=Corynebacterium epidermidicanis TaxID=1050174 RepID=A0A0G3GPT1_9CORY|nr:WYL domain-containing protein [Corynebacterium epidermidicanis]AKK03134.1 putative transcriptional regulator [Corynebacterium epidermidicanis]
MAARGHEYLPGLVRMLNLLPYFASHPDHSLMEAAADLGMSPEQIKDDLNRLWCCGLPGLYPGDLVDLEIDYSGVRVLETQGLDKPLRLTHREAGALLLALENLEQSPGLINRDAVLSAAAKLRGLMGRSVEAVVDAIAEADTSQSEVETAIESVRRAVDERRRISFSYHSLNEEHLSQRVISITRIFSAQTGTYLVGWDHDKAAHRNFRLDRMSDIVVLDEPAEPHARQLVFDARDPFSLSKNSRDVLIKVAREALWLADYVPMELKDWHDARWRYATLRVASDAWLQRFILSQGGSIVIADNHSAAQALTQRALAGLAAYDSAIGTMRS